MSTDVRNQQQKAAEPQNLSELAFPEYEKARNGQKLESTKGDESALADDESAEQKKSSESDTEETEAKEEDDETEAEDEDDESESEAEESEKEQPAKKKSKGGFQRRIAKATKRTADAEARAAAAEAELARLRSGSDSKAKDDPKKAAEPAAGKPDPKNFDSHEEYLDALTDWKYETRKKADETAAEKKRIEDQQKKQLSTFAERRKSFEEKTEDFDDVMDSVEDIRVSPTLVQLLVESENGPELMYELAKNRAEYERINALPYGAAARELGKFDARLADRASKAAEEKTKKLTTKAPKPIAPVGGGKSVVVEKSIYDKDISFSEYERQRNKELRRKQG
jgi:hypothetical protein